MRIIILLQLFIYLLIIPIISIFYGSFSQFHLFFYTSIFIFFYILGARFFYIRKPHLESQKKSKAIEISVNYRCYLFFIIFTIWYIYLVNYYGIFNRRIGSENIALIFSQIDLVDLIILRSYEIILVPLLISFLYFRYTNYEEYKKKYVLNYLIFVLFFLGIINTGIHESRGDIIWLLIFVYIFTAPHSNSIKRIKRRGLSNNLRISLLGFFSILIIVIFLFLRNAEQVGEQFFVDFIERLNGLAFIALIDEKISIPFFGTFDIDSLYVYQSLLPFLDVSSELKEIGLTSTKSYYLQEILGSNLFDITNTIFTDLYYIGGIFLIVIGGYGYGFLSFKLDSIIKRFDFKNTFFYALVFGAILNLVRVENDFISLLPLTLRDAIILYLVYKFLAIKVRKKRFVI